MTRLVATETNMPPAQRLAFMADWPTLAAAPVFAAMAWISTAGTPAVSICTIGPTILPINEMALMYLLMSIVHLSPWLRRLAAYSRRSARQNT